MILVGLTGSIAMGKTTTAHIFKNMGFTVFESDKTVHELLINNKNLKNKILETFPNVLDENNLISRKKIAEIVFKDMAKLEILEKIIHPFVFDDMKTFIKNIELQGKDIVILDVPLLFETGLNKICDKVITVSVSRQEQIKRILMRKNMTYQIFINIEKRQVSDSFKRKNSDYVIKTNKGKRNVAKKIRFLKKSGFFKKSKNTMNLEEFLNA